MLDRLRELGIFHRDSEEEPPETASGRVFTALHLFSADLLLLTGANATLHFLRSRSAAEATRGAATEYDLDHDRFRTPSRLPGAAAWAPLLIGTLGSAVQTVHALQPSERTDLAARTLSGVALGLGLVGAANRAAAAVRGDEPFSIAPLLFGYAGLLGFLVDRQENKVAEEEADLERRASIIERFVPRRRTKIERIVVHV
jgi:hypothetical protein